jgi:predicted transcriptional regulator
MGKDEIAWLVERVAALPEQAQAELIKSLAEIESKYAGVYRLSDDERAGVRRGLEEARRGKFASDEEVEAVFSRFRA